MVTMQSECFRSKFFDLFPGSIVLIKRGQKSPSAEDWGISFNFKLYYYDHFYDVQQGIVLDLTQYVMQ